MTGKLGSSGFGALERFATTARADFRFAPLNALLLVAIFVLGLAVHLSFYSFGVEAVALALGSALVLAVLLHTAQIWEAVVLPRDGRLPAHLPPTEAAERDTADHRVGSASPVLLPSDCLPMGKGSVVALREVSITQAVGSIPRCAGRGQSGPIRGPADPGQ